MKRVFISFRHEDKPQINGLRLLAANDKFDVEFYDESLTKAIDSANAAYVRRRIREKINRTSLTLCMISELTYTSTWVDWELEESISKGNDIVCMALPNSPPQLIFPEPIRRLKLPCYVWDIHYLARVIEALP